VAVEAVLGVVEVTLMVNFRFVRFLCRYYGLSTPTPVSDDDPKHPYYLSHEQALADYVAVLTDLQATLAAQLAARYPGCVVAPGGWRRSEAQQNSKHVGRVRVCATPCGSVWWRVRACVLM
jgi:hypothetical protein